ncbi:MAG: hypothetical protein NTU41_10420, partial [Chloroflexi bacterium]|nr:hypothetical protein [Chloroflexota bacterium]
LPSDIPTEGGYGKYNGIPIVIYPSAGVYCAFTDAYVIVCYASTAEATNLFYQTLDRILNPSLASLAGSADFRDAQSALPSDRMGMFYCNYEHIWEQMAAENPPTVGGELLIEAFDNFVPSCFAAS